MKTIELPANQTLSITVLPNERVVKLIIVHQQPKPEPELREVPDHWFPSYFDRYLEVKK